MIASHARRAGAVQGHDPTRKGWGKRQVARYFRRWNSNRLRRRLGEREP